jgi:hypothetical protein
MFGSSLACRATLLFEKTQLPLFVVQIEVSKAEPGVDVEANTTWMLEQLKELLQRLSSSVIMCPVYVFTSLLLDYGVG